MDYLWLCVKGFLKWTLIACLFAGVFYVGFNHGRQFIEHLRDTPKMQEVEPVKLQVAGTSALYM